MSAKNIRFSVLLALWFHLVCSERLLKFFVILLVFVLLDGLLLLAKAVARFRLDILPLLNKPKPPTFAFYYHKQGHCLINKTLFFFFKFLPPTDLPLI